MGCGWCGVNPHYYILPVDCRNAILSEINQEYIAMAHARIGASIK